MKKVSSFSDFVAKTGKWASELRTLRKILASTELEETIKWGMPCYTYNGKNVVGIASFTDYFGLWFYQGATLEDANKKLISAQEGKTKALRQWRMTHARDIKPSIVKRYVKQSIENLASGVEIRPSKPRPVSVPQELKAAFAKSSSLEAAFAKLTPGRKREYCAYIAEASRPATKKRRIEKMAPLIKSGKGLHDRYR